MSTNVPNHNSQQARRKDLSPALPSPWPFHHPTLPLEATQKLPMTKARRRGLLVHTGWSGKSKGNGELCCFCFSLMNLLECAIQQWCWMVPAIPAKQTDLSTRATSRPLSSLIYPGTVKRTQNCQRGSFPSRDPVSWLPLWLSYPHFLYTAWQLPWGALTIPIRAGESWSSTMTWP
jgi:hypothetical protein